MTRLEYLCEKDIPSDVKKTYIRGGREWRLMAVTVHHDRDGQEIKMAFLRAVDGGGCEWEVPLKTLQSLGSK
jgi:hypothetical protein